MENELTLRHLAPYLSYGLKWSLQGMKTFTMTGITNETLFTEEGTVLHWPKDSELPQALFPILRPLSDIEEDQELFNQINEPHQYPNFGHFERSVLSGHAPYILVRHLISEHYDVFGLIEEGLAIDINQLENQ